MADESNPTPNPSGTPDTPPGSGNFPHPGVIGEGVDNTPPAERPESQPITSEQFEQLQNSFNSLKEEAAQREQNLQQTIQTLMMRPAGQEPTQQQTPPQPQGLDLSDLPDPVQNPKEYNQALSQRVNEHIGATLQSSQQSLLGQMTSTQALNNLYQRFASEHSDLAQRQALLQGAAAVEFGQLRAQGIDPATVAQQNPDSLIANIAKRMQAELGTTQSPNGQPPPQQPPQTGQPPQPNAQTARVEGLGDPSTPGGNTPPAPPKPKSLVQQIRDSQVKDGLL